MIGFQGFFVLTKWWGRVHQPPLFNTPPFCTEVYLARMFDLVFFLSMNFACMLGPCAPKKAPFCKNLFHYHLPSFFSSVTKEQPFFFVRKWAQWYVRPVFFLQCWRKVKRSYPCFLPRGWVVLESQADRDKWHGCQFWDLSSYNSAACLHQGLSMQAKFVWRLFLVAPIHSVGCAHAICRLFARAHVL